MKKTMLLCCLLFCIHIAMAQKQQAQTPSVFDKFMSAITNMPALFQKLVDNVNKLAISQNKKKFYTFDTKMINQLNALKSQKRILAGKLEPGTAVNKEAVKQQIIHLQVAVNNLESTISEYSNLLDGLHINGFNTTALRDGLAINFIQKGQFLNKIIDEHDKKNEIYAAKVSAELAKGISLLDSSAVKLQKFDSELRKKNND